MSFKDHFSGHADAYARHRPRYPARLVDLPARPRPRYRSANPADPLEAIAADLRAGWDPGARTVRWPLALLVGRA